MARSITVIPTRVANQNQVGNIEQTKKRMAAYCRVSTDQEEQLSSYDAQVRFYTGYINNHPDYDFAGIYADEGISGTNTKKREQFNKMIEDCKAGKIDMIITKSISRFTRNTLDCLNYVRLLKELGIGVIFEKENINSIDAKGEVLLTILSSLAQDESRSISENCTWGIRRRFEQGKVSVNHTKFLGYDKDKDGNLVINPKQAKIVRKIYKYFLDGLGVNSIARKLEADGVKGWNGKSKWRPGTINKMLSNEKYKGDALLQKTYTLDYLSKKRAKNDGKVPQYYVKESHPAIIDKDTWEAVQLEIQRRKEFSKKYGSRKLDGDNPLSGRVICGQCGAAFGRKVWNSTDERLRRIIWRCNKKYAVKGKVSCDSKHIDEEDLKNVFVNVFNAVVDERDEFVDRWRGMVMGEDVLGRIVGKRFIEMFEGGIDRFDNGVFLKTVEKIDVVGDGGVRVCLLDGSVVECDVYFFKGKMDINSR